MGVSLASVSASPRTGIRITISFKVLCADAQPRDPRWLALTLHRMRKVQYVSIASSITGGGEYIDKQHFGWTRLSLVSLRNRDPLPPSMARRHIAHIASPGTQQNIGRTGTTLRRIARPARGMPHGDRERVRPAAWLGGADDISMQPESEECK